MYKIISISNNVKEFFTAKGIFSLCASAVTFLFGDNYVFLQVLFILMCVDFITGIIKSLKLRQKIKSKRMRDTILKITLYALFLIAIHQVTRITIAFDWLHYFAVSFLAATELLSIIENLACAGIVIPKWVVEKLHRYLETGTFNDKTKED